jgi:hypothetical protein
MDPCDTVRSRAVKSLTDSGRLSVVPSSHHLMGATTMIAQPPSITAQPLAESVDIVEPLSLKRIVAMLQVVLATRRAAYNDASRYSYTLAGSV